MLARGTSVQQNPASNGAEMTGSLLEHRLAVTPKEMSLTQQRNSKALLATPSSILIKGFPVVGS
jgi:hypothetical protein